MKKDKHKYQIGDVLYEMSVSYSKVFAWKITDIFVENYISGPKVVFKVERDKERGWVWAKEMYLSDIQAMYDTKEEADEALKDWMKEQICFTNISVTEEAKGLWNSNR